MAFVKTEKSWTADFHYNVECKIFFKVYKLILETSPFVVRPVVANMTKQRPHVSMGELAKKLSDLQWWRWPPVRRAFAVG